MNPGTDYPPLTAEQQRLVEQWQRYAFREALKYRACGLDLDDLRAEALFALVLAAQRFDADNAQGASFVTYATYWIRARVWRAAELERNLVRIDSTQARRKVLFHVRRQLRGGLDLEDLQPDKVAAAVGAPEEDAREILVRLRARRGDVRLDSPTRGGRAGALPVDSVTEERALEAQQLRGLRAAIDRMNADHPLEAVVLRERFLRDQPITLRELGKRFELSPERVRQLEVQALERLRREVRA